MAEEEGGLAGRVLVLEQRLRRVSKAAADARYLAIGASGEVGDLQAKVIAHQRAIQALHRDVSDSRREMDAGFASVEHTLQGRHDETRNALVAILGMLDQLAGES